MSDQEHPTVEQSLHSIALSLIEMNKYNRDNVRNQKTAIRHNIRVANAEAFRASMGMRPKPTWWEKLFSVLPGTSSKRRAPSKLRSTGR